MERMKKYNAEQIGDVYTMLNQTEVLLDPIKHPIPFNAKVNELVESGMERNYAESIVKCSPIVLDVYYSTDKDCKGLYCVESEVVECSTIFNPYNGIEMEDYDDTDLQPIYTKLYTYRRELKNVLLHKRENIDSIYVILKNIFGCDVSFSTDYEPLKNEDNRIDIATIDKHFIGSIWYLETNDNVCNMYITEITLDID